MPEIINRNIYINNIVAAVATISVSILLLNKRVSCFFLNTAKAEAKITAIVVTFIPPAVDPGAPPISIKSIITHWLAPVSFDKSTVENPAVLVVTLEKNEPIIFSEELIPFHASFENSQK